jgi:hypothetical protein
VFLFGSGTTIVVAALVIMLVGASTTKAVVVTIDPDDFSNGTDISNAFPGVTLSAVGSMAGLNGIVYSRTAPAHASTGTNVFGNSLSGTDSDGNLWNECWKRNNVRLRADFDNLANYVTIDIISNDIGTDCGALEVYDSDDNLLSWAEIHKLEPGIVFTAEINRSSFDIAYIIATGIEGDTVALDKLAYVPEPATALLLCLGSLAFLPRRK